MLREPARHRNDDDVGQRISGDDPAYFIQCSTEASAHLGQGYVDGGKIVCPWHGWEYDATTGQLFDDPKSKLAVYPVKVENEDVLVDI